jgi:hypothetical protein
MKSGYLMHFYGPLIRQGYQITLDWMAQYSLGMRAVFAILFGLVSWGAVERVFFGDPRIPVLKRIARLIIEVVFAPVVILGALFVVSVVYYAPGALLQRTANDVAKLQTNLQQTRDQKEIEKLNKQFADYKTERITSDQHVAANSEARLGKCRDAYNKLLNDLTSEGPEPIEIDDLENAKHELREVQKKEDVRNNSMEQAQAMFAAVRKFRTAAHIFRSQSPDPCT